MNVNQKSILNDLELPTYQLGCTNLLKELFTKLWVCNSKMFGKLASKGLLLGPGSSPHESSYSGVTPVFLISLLMIFSCHIISSRCNLLLQEALSNKHVWGLKHIGKTMSSSVR
jgi:hypothetical protein